MKAFLAIFALSFTLSAQAEVPFYICGFGKIDKLATYDPIKSDIQSAPLSPKEVDYLESQFDYQFDCDEGVLLLGAEQTFYISEMQIQYTALCSKDSLGSKKVALKLNCKEDYL